MKATIKKFWDKEERQMVFEINGVSHSAIVADGKIDGEELIEEVELDGYNLYVEKGMDWKFPTTNITAVKK